MPLNRSSLSRRWVRVWGNELRSRSFDRLLYLYLNKLGWMGTDSRQLLEKHVQPGMTVVDVGANVGLYASLCSRLVGDEGKVIAIEPETSNLIAIREMIERNGISNIELHAVAASEKTETLSLNSDPLNSGNHSVSATDHRADGSHAISAKTLDEIIADRPVHFIKMDVQGWEMHALRGGIGTLSRNRPLRMLIEVWPAGLKRNGSTPDQLTSFLRDLGFAIDTLGRKGSLDSSSGLDFYDILATA